MATEDEHAPAAGAPVDGQSANPWARHGREDLQGSHSLTAPLARWAHDPVEPPPLDAPPGESEPAIAIPAALRTARPALRLPEDAVCRSRLAALVIAVWAAAGNQVSRRQPVMVIEA